jgi:hypothetical protein
MSAPRIEDLIEALRQYRPLLLAMEAIGWFHMAGKARLEFLRGQGGEKSDYKEREWHKQETPPFAWDDLLGWANRPTFPRPQGRKALPNSRKSTMGTIQDFSACSRPLTGWCPGRRRTYRVPETT